MFDRNLNLLMNSATILVMLDAGGEQRKLFYKLEYGQLTRKFNELALGSPKMASL